MKITELLNEIEFNNLSLNEKRVAIAKDVITRFNNKNLIEERGNIFQGDAFYERNIDPKVSINNNRCEVCARGALLCSWIGNFNNVSWDELRKLGGIGEQTYSSTAFPPALLNVFGREMLDNIEAAFEHSTYDWHYDTVETQKYVDAFEREEKDKYGESFGTPIIELMEWIITNKGEFPLP